MRNYTVIKWEKVLLWLIPPILRKQTHYDWLNVLMAPLRLLFEETLYKMQHTGQVIYLEKVLNEVFNPDKVYNPNYSTLEKRSNELIYIEDSLKPTLQFVYLHREYGDFNIAPKVFMNQEINLQGKSPLYLASVTDYTEISYADFRVFIPDNLNLDLSHSSSIQYYTRKEGKVEIDKSKLSLKEISDRLFFKPHEDLEKTFICPVEMHTAKYDNLLNFYKLAGKTYETYAYPTKKIIQR